MFFLGSFQKIANYFRKAGYIKSVSAIKSQSYDNMTSRISSDFMMPWLYCFFICKLYQFYQLCLYSPLLIICILYMSDHFWIFYINDSTQSVTTFFLYYSLLEEEPLNIEAHKNI